MPYCGKLMDRKAAQRRAEYRDKTQCETHKRPLVQCRPLDPSCMVCGCGGLCDSKEPCPMATRPRCL